MTTAARVGGVEPGIEAADLDVAKRILEPLSVEEFRRSYWGQKPLHLTGAAEKFRFLFDAERFHAAVRRCHAKQTPPGHFRLRAVDRDTSGLSRGRDISPDEMEAALANGETICVNDVSAGDDDLAYCADEFRRELGHAGRTHFSAYQSRHGAGAAMHFDARIACTLQLSGSKRWRYSRGSALAWPRANAQADARGVVRYLGLGGLDPWEQIEAVTACDFTEVLLSPGDLLCLPAGTWHETRSEGESFALNLSSSPQGFADVMQLTLKGALEHEPAWRSLAAVGRLEGDEGWPPEALAYCSERLREVADLIIALQHDPRPLLRAWATLGRFATVRAQ